MTWLALTVAAAGAIVLTLFAVAHLAVALGDLVAWLRYRLGIARLARSMRRQEAAMR